MKNLLVASAFLSFFLTGCISAIPSGLPSGHRTDVRLQENNFKLIKPNVIGEDTGFSLFCIFPLVSPQQILAMTDLCEKTGVTPGKAYAFTNLIQERTTTCYFIFSIPKVSIRADVVEFTENSKQLMDKN